ncbi:hypothetical protein OROHE_026980 [Orobanche hederae]
MDEEKIGLVLAKTSELRSKIVNCIHKTTSNVERESRKSKSQESEANPDEDSQDLDGDEEAEILLNIKDALESLEGQLSSLQFDFNMCISCQNGPCGLEYFQRDLEKFLNYPKKELEALQQQQWYEKEAALAEIEHSQKELLKELKEYKGQGLEIIHEAIAFASVTDDNTDLLLPPYPSRPSHPVVSENDYLSTSPPTRRFPQNDGLKKPDKVSDGNNRRRYGPWCLVSSVGGLLGMAAKAALTVVGVMAVLSLAASGPRMRKRDDGFVKLVGLFRTNGGKGSGGRGGDKCPPGKVAVTEDGEMRRVAKERVEVPFESIVATPDVSYGCG